ncbi:MAG: site-specific integrase [Clostridia bacterium]|nr:site-specific integrase [Clostridia bacterium]
MALPKKRADGRYRKVVNGKAFYGRTRSELDEKIDEYFEALNAPKMFKDIADEWWGEIYDTLANQTLKGYRPALKRIIEEFGDMDVTTITASDIHNFYKYLKTLEFSTKTISNYKTVLNQILELAVIKGHIVYNPCAHVRLPRGKPAVERPRASAHDEEIILAHPDAWIFPFLCLTSGLRKGEALALTWGDVDFEKRIIRVNKSVEHILDAPYLKEPKTKAGNRLVPLISILADALLRLKARVVAHPDFYIVSKDGTSLMRKSEYDRKYDSYKREYGITATAQRLRKSFASIAAEQGAGIKDLQYSMGHTSSVLTLDTYIKAGENTVNNLRDAIEDRFQAQKKAPK